MGGSGFWPTTITFFYPQTSLSYQRFYDCKHDTIEKISYEAQCKSKIKFRFFFYFSYYLSLLVEIGVEHSEPFVLIIGLSSILSRALMAAWHNLVILSWDLFCSDNSSSIQASLEYKNKVQILLSNLQIEYNSVSSCFIFST